MNKTEEAWAAALEFQRREGSVLWWAYEAITLKLASDCRFTPDFLVQLADGTLECHEVKGWFRDDAKVKIKVAAALFPLVFRLVIKKKGAQGFDVEEVK